MNKYINWTKNVLELDSDWEVVTKINILMLKSLNILAENVLCILDAMNTILIIQWSANFSRKQKSVGFGIYRDEFTSGSVNDEKAIKKCCEWSTTVILT